MNIQTGQIAEMRGRPFLAGRRSLAAAPQTSGPAEFVIVLMPGFSQLSLAAFIDPLRVANALCGIERFRWRLVSEDGQTVESAGAIPVGVSGSLEDETRLLSAGKFSGAVVLCAGNRLDGPISPVLGHYLRTIGRGHVPVYALGSGVWALAEAGLPTDQKLTIHWENRAAFSETFDHVEVEDALYLLDGRLTSCAGEMAAFDMTIDLVRTVLGEDIAHSVCTRLVADRWRTGTRHQTVPSRLNGAVLNEKLIEAIRVMERHLEEPLSMTRIARQIGLSRRQIERLFAKNFDTTPINYYRLMRLEKARQLVEYTNLSITKIGIACGFVSNSHFTKCFRREFGVSPLALRGSR